MYCDGPKNFFASSLEIHFEPTPLNKELVFAKKRKDFQSVKKIHKSKKTDLSGIKMNGPI